ncbi:MAG: hypothetical protein U0441_08905 [Polyangiaceae bacterium]
MQRSLSIFLGCFVAYLLPACGDADTIYSQGGSGGGSTTTQTPTYSYPTAESFCGAVAKAECSSAVVTACYGSDQASLTQDTESCVTARSARCNPDNLPYHPEYAEACVNARAAALTDAVWTHADVDAVENACLPVFSKGLEKGSQCSADTDCGGGYRCLLKIGALTGVCDSPNLIPAGDACSGASDVCDTGYYCSPKVWHCLALGKENEVCSEGAPCGADYYCSDPDTGVCVAKTKNGLDCAGDEVCQGGFCVGATANTSGKCSSTLPLTITSTSCDDYR